MKYRVVVPLRRTSSSNLSMQLQRLQSHKKAERTDSRARTVRRYIRGIMRARWLRDRADARAILRYRVRTIKRNRLAVTRGILLTTQWWLRRIALHSRFWPTFPRDRDRRRIIIRDHARGGMVLSR
jgi:hypothetical protein